MLFWAHFITKCTFFLHFSYVFHTKNKFYLYIVLFFQMKRVTLHGDLFINGYYLIFLL